ncbi:MAG: hypothetical protein K1X88_02795 [Nannocystaceae bacterium]|nr:hypothetical protein [Nannocystaceae bacterium]
MAKAPATRRRAAVPQALAVSLLRQVEQGRGFSNRVLAEGLERNLELEAGERGIVTALVYGVLRHRSRLDVHIDACARDGAKLGAVPRMLLRVGAFELLELGREPANAIDHAIAAASGWDPSGRLGKLAHAVLERLAHEATARDEVLAAAAPLDVLERRWSIPRWLAGRWLKQLGAERALARAQALARVPSVDVRVDLGRIDAQTARTRLQAERPGARIELVPEQPQALRVHGGGDLFYGALHDEGLISVQGLAAQQPARVLAPQPGEQVLDACAGMGVKTLQLAELMTRRGTLVAADRDATKLVEHARLRERGRLDVASLALHVLTTDLAGDASELDALGRFDAVLLDVPCTGLGNLARHPEIRWLRRFEDLAAAAAVQSQLIARLRARLRAGGRMVVAVCSPEPEEGARHVAALLAQGGLSLLHERTWTPEDDGTEGFYVACVQDRGAPAPAVAGS